MDGDCPLGLVRKDEAGVYYRSPFSPTLHHLSALLLRREPPPQGLWFDQRCGPRLFGGAKDSGGADWREWSAPPLAGRRMTAVRYRGAGYALRAFAGAPIRYRHLGGQRAAWSE